MVNNPVIWSEGMFLKQHHFQQQSRYFENLINEKTSFMYPLAWGITHITINHALLNIGKFSLTKCRGILPDGTVFHVSEEDDCPTPLEITEEANSKTIYLALPLNRTRHLSEEYEVSDSANQESQKATIKIAKLSLQLMLNSEDLNAYSAIPIARIIEIKPSQQIILDHDFIPPCLYISASNLLSDFINELQGLLEHRAETLSHRLTDTQQSATAEVSDFMLLQFVNRFEPLFYHLSVHNAIHPEILYRTLIQLQGELATLTHDRRRPLRLSKYQHHNLCETFKPVLKEIRHSLSMVLKQNAVALAVNEHDFGVWVAEIPDKSLLTSSLFVLAVYAEIATEQIRNIFPSQVKIAPIEELDNFISRALPGIGLQAMPVAPRQIPYHANFSYFSLDNSSEYWKKLINSSGIGLHIGNQYPGLKLELWAIKG